MYSYFRRIDIYPSCVYSSSFHVFANADSIESWSAKSWSVCPSNNTSSNFVSSNECVEMLVSTLCCNLPHLVPYRTILSPRIISKNFNSHISANLIRILNQNYLKKLTPWAVPNAVLSCARC